MKKIVTLTLSLLVIACQKNEQADQNTKPSKIETVKAPVKLSEDFLHGNWSLVSEYSDDGVTMLEEGTISSKMNVRVLRDNIVIHEGILDSLRRFKDEAKEVKSGTECGIGISNYSDIKIGDKIEVFEREEIKRKL